MKIETPSRCMKNLLGLITEPLAVSEDLFCAETCLGPNPYVRMQRVSPIADASILLICPLKSSFDQRVKALQDLTVLS